ncbi:layilin isoform X2 [Pangasianodon hypophthalmus]|uniref:layilin isoform X2 n=1 Tax=Pangasianodon hypophthalmus TaxID=310915 RepID=UPI002307AB53|nr:layilin isoform X2 [Pangasianodon hypophthalmus]
MDVRRVLAFSALMLSVSTSGSKVLGGQNICKRGTNIPCYKIGYFEDSWRKLNFEEAQRACRSDGGDLLSIESAAEQNLIEGLIQELKASDGDFWIGLRREPKYEESSTDCESQYYWLDGSRSNFRNWHTDEPSCGYEVCVVMYHQPSASSDEGNKYMFQWNDDNCETKNNFICKYTKDIFITTTTTEVARNPSVTVHDDGMSVVAAEHTANGVFCFKLFTKRRRKQTETPADKHGTWAPGDRCSSPSPDVYNVIRRQHETDLSDTRPHTKNTSFLGSSPDTPTDEYDNLGGHDTESGFVTLASTESGFITNDIYESYQNRSSTRYHGEHSWLDNELYGY